LLDHDLNAVYLNVDGMLTKTAENALC